MNTTRVVIASVGAAAMMLSVAACGSGGSSSGSSTVDPKDATIGFVAVGPEGGFRSANENDVKSAFKKAGINLKYSPTKNNDQKPQLDAMDSFINDGVDVIILSATEDTGWDSELKKAKEADIPVITLDRNIQVSDPSLVASHIGPSNVWASQQAADYITKTFKGKSGASGVVLEGPAGLSVVRDRNTGWNDAIKKWNSDNPDAKINVLEHQSANWDTEQGKSVTEGLIDKYGKKLQFIFSQNDEMALGAIQAVKAKGMTSGPGKDVEVVAIDGTKPCLQALIDGTLSLDIEYNPIFGQEAVDTVKKLLKGENVQREITIDSQVFDKESAAKAIASRPY